MATKKKKGRPDAGTIRVDMSGVESGGRARLPEGDYKVKVSKIKPEETDDGKKYLYVTFEVTDGSQEGKKVSDRIFLTPKSLWRLKKMMEAMGFKVPNKVLDIPYKKFVDRELAITLTDDEYKGKISSSVADFIDPEILSTGGVDDDEDVLDDDEDEDDEDDEDEGDEDDDDELEEVDLDEKM